MKKIVVVDFGAGNLLSVCRAFHHLGVEVTLATTPEAVLAADRLVLPGVGAFGACMSNLRASGLDAPVKAFAASGKPFLGICVGMQMLFDASEEFGENPGLGLVPGRVVPVPPVGTDGRPHRIPHVGWNRIQPPEGRAWAGTPLAAVRPGEAVYFVHSFMGVPVDPADALAFADYDGVPLLAAVRRGNLTGCQFHPEKSGLIGLAILGGFLDA